MSYYNFGITKSKELNVNNSLIKKEAINMKKTFDVQGNQKHGREMSSHYQTSVIADKMFSLVVKEFKKL